MNLLRRLRLIRFKENLLRIFPLVVLCITFYYTAELYQEKKEIENIYFQLQSKYNYDKQSVVEEIESIPAIDKDKLEVVLYIAKEYNYSRVDATCEFALFEFKEDAFFEAREFEKALDHNDYEYNLQMAEGEGGWNGMRIEVAL